MTFKWWWRIVPGRLRSQWKVETTRMEAASSIADNRLSFELMAQRPRMETDKLNMILLADARKHFDEIAARVGTATTVDQLSDLIADGNSQEAASAYLCPANEIADEGHRAIDNLNVWGIPKASVDRLRLMVEPRLRDAVKKPEDGRSALYAVLVEVDEWSEYIEDYEGNMKMYTSRLFWAMVVLLLVAGACLHFAPFIPPLLWFGLFLFGGAGSCVSVLAKMPTLEVSDPGERDIYGRRIWSRIAVGATGSLIGCALLAWGLFPIAVQKQTFIDALDATTASPIPAGTTVKSLIVIGMAMILGWSERTLTSFEQKVFGNSKERK